MKKYKRISVILSALLVVSVGLHIYLFCTGGALLWKTYLQAPSELYSLESGILFHNQVFQEGDSLKIQYDFDNEAFPELLQKYDLKAAAGNGSAFEQAKNLMNSFSGRLAHQSDYQNQIEMNALDLLNYSLDQKKHGINCRAKAQILNEMCLALGIYARKVWISPASPYDHECHVVNEIWDSALHKWIMLDITNNQYWVDQDGTPLSILEIRTHLAGQEFCTPVLTKDSLTDLSHSLRKNYGTFLYIAKNMAYLGYCDTYSTGESDIYLLFPETMTSTYDKFLSIDSVKASPYAF